MNEEKKRKMAIEEMLKKLAEMDLQSVILIKSNTDALYNLEAMKRSREDKTPQKSA